MPLLQQPIQAVGKMASRSDGCG